MKYFLKYLYIAVFLYLYSCNSNSQCTTGDELIEDLKYLHQAVLTGHPVTINQNWTDSLGTLIEELKGSKSDIFSAFNYENKVREALTKTGCSHTTIKKSPLKEIYFNEIGEKKYLPIRCFADSTGLYIIGAELPKDEKLINFPIKVKSINNKHFSEIISNILIHQPVDGHQKTLGYAILNKYAHILISRDFIGTDRFEIRYIDKNDIENVFFIDAIEDFNPDQFHTFQPPSESLYTKEHIKLYNLNTNTMYLKIMSINYVDYKTTISEIFQIIEDNETENLVIDLRGNGGGNPKHALHFLSFILQDTLSQIDIRPNGDISKFLNSKLKLAGVWIWDKITTKKKTDKGIEYVTNITFPQKKQYEGKIYILTDGFTSSAACTLTAYLRYKAGAICIGQETAGGETSCNANSFQTLKLPNSNIEINFPLFHFIHQIDIPENHHGIKPDIEIHYNASSYLNNSDLEMEKIFELIK